LEQAGGRRLGEGRARTRAEGLVFTINDVATAHQLLVAGVDGIITDNPAIQWKALAVR